MESIHKFVISRAKISRSSVKINDLFFTYNGENLQEDLAEVAEVANEKFPDLNDLNGATMTNLIHLFNEDEIKTCYFMCAISLIGKIGNKEFKLEFSSKRGSFLAVKQIATEVKNEEVNDENASEDPKDIEEPKDETKGEEIKDENTSKDIQEDPKNEEVNDENSSEIFSEESKDKEELDKSEETPEEPKDDKKKVKDDKKKKAAKDASDKL